MLVVFFFFFFNFIWQICDLGKLLGFALMLCVRGKGVGLSNLKGHSFHIFETSSGYSSLVTLSIGRSQGKISLFAEFKRRAQGSQNSNFQGPRQSHLQTMPVSSGYFHNSLAWEQNWVFLEQKGGSSSGGLT